MQRHDAVKALEIYRRAVQQVRSSGSKVLMYHINFVIYLSFTYKAASCATVLYIYILASLLLYSFYGF